MDLGLKGKVAMIAAASKGLGRAVAEELAKEGCRVAIAARTKSDLERTAGEISKSTGAEVFWQAFDVRSEEAIRSFVAATEKRFGRIDICVTNSGGPPSKKFAETTAAEWHAAAEDMLFSAVTFARETLPIMQRNHWGRFITITSVSVKQPIDGLILSNAVRAGVTGLAKTLAGEYGASGITVNNVCPGFTLTGRLEELAEKRAKDSGTTREHVLAAMAASMPLGRVVRTDEFAAVVAFLVSERASAVNGTTIAVDGGMVKSLL